MYRSAPVANATTNIGMLDALEKDIVADELARLEFVRRFLCLAGG
jgi:hypothetical protein